MSSSGACAARGSRCRLRLAIDALAAVRVVGLEDRDVFRAALAASSRRSRGTRRRSPVRSIEFFASTPAAFTRRTPRRPWILRARDRCSARCHGAPRGPEHRSSSPASMARTSTACSRSRGWIERSPRSWGRCSAGSTRIARSNAPAQARRGVPSEPCVAR